MFSVFGYIIKNNKGIYILKYMILGVFFQFFKRVTNSIISIKIFNNKMLFLYPHCNVSSMFAYTDIPDKAEINQLRELIKSTNKEDICFFDIGANIGSYSVAMMDICDQVIAFEPHPYTFNRCKMNFLLNGYSPNNVKQVAMSNKVGKIFFSDYGGSSTVNHIIEDKSGIEVNVITLDDFILGNGFLKQSKYVLKVDVEGFEKQVFEGGEMFLSNYDILGIVFECFDKKDVFKILNKYGYMNIEKLIENNFLATKS
jgi:FkbM family methyltransferase